MVLIQERVPPLRISRAPFAATLGTCLNHWLAALWGEADANFRGGLAVVPPEGEVGALLPCQLEIQNLTGIPQFVTLAIQDLQGTPHQSISFPSLLSLLFRLTTRALQMPPLNRTTSTRVRWRPAS